MIVMWALLKPFLIQALKIKKKESGHHPGTSAAAAAAFGKALLLKHFNIQSKKKNPTVIKSM